MFFSVVQSCTAVALASSDLKGITCNPGCSLVVCGGERTKLSACVDNATQCTYNYKNTGQSYNMQLPMLEVCQPAYAWVSQNRLVQCFDKTGAVSLVGLSRCWCSYIAHQLTRRWCFGLQA